MVEKLGADDPTVQTILQGKTPDVVAAELVHGTELDSAKVRKEYVDGQAKIDASTDPFILLAKAIDAQSRQIRKDEEDHVSSVEVASYEKISAASFAVYGTTGYPDATFTPRLAFGRVLGYQQDGKYIPPTTTIAGAFNHEKENGGVPPYNLPERWHQGKSKLNLKLPLNQVNTADIIGGNSGSPVVNRKGELVGLIFDGNRQSLISDFTYTENEDNPARAVTVHPAAMIHTLRVLYGASALADELEGKNQKR
jgi:hypothetical protein